MIAACKATQAKLIFLDSFYTYGRVSGPITEATPTRPVSKKGQIPVAVEQLLLAERHPGGLAAILAKAAVGRCSGSSWRFWPRWFVAA